MDKRFEAAEIFAHIYRTDHWEGGSGIGSASDATFPYRAIVQRLLDSREIRRVVDIGCGDWQLGSLVDWSGVDYQGLDVVPEVIEANQARFGTAEVRFVTADAREAELPSGDLLLVKDVLQHWPNEDIDEFVCGPLATFPFALLTNDISSTRWDGEVNADIKIGEWRTLDLQADPFRVRARAYWDFDVRGEWTKRALLVVRESRWRFGALIPGSVRRIASDIRSPTLG